MRWPYHYVETSAQSSGATSAVRRRLTCLWNCALPLFRSFISFTLSTRVFHSFLFETDHPLKKRRPRPYKSTEWQRLKSLIIARFHQQRFYCHLVVSAKRVNADNCLNVWWWTSGVNIETTQIKPSLHNISRNLFNKIDFILLIILIIQIFRQFDKFWRCSALWFFHNKARY